MRRPGATRSHMQRMHALSMKALRDPHKNAKFRAAVSAGKGGLSPIEQHLVLQDIDDNRRYAEIAKDWLVSKALISKIALANGRRRQIRGQVQ